MQKGNGFSPSSANKKLRDITNEKENQFTKVEYALAESNLITAWSGRV